MTLKELLSVTTIENYKLHISIKNNNIISTLTYITEYITFSDCEVEDITVEDDELYITIKERLDGGDKVNVGYVEKQGESNG